MNSKGLDEVHEIMERIYNEDKNLSKKEKIIKLHSITELFLKKNNLNNLKIISKKVK